MTAYTLQERHYPGFAAFGWDAVNAPQEWPLMVWQTRLRQMMGGKKEANERVFHCPGRPTEGFDFPLPGEAIGSRPLATAEHVGYGYVVGEPLIHSMAQGFLGARPPLEPERRYSYGLNYKGAIPGRALGYETNEDGQHPEINNREPRVARVKKPEAMIAIADTSSIGAIMHQPLIRPINDAGPVGNLHRGGSNVLWCDGHVDWRRMEEITYTEEEWVSNAPKVSRVGPFWNASHTMGGLSPSTGPPVVGQALRVTDLFGVNSPRSPAGRQTGLGSRIASNTASRLLLHDGCQRLRPLASTRKGLQVAALALPAAPFDSFALIRGRA